MPPAAEGEGRIASIGAAVLGAPEDAASEEALAAARRLSRLFQEVLLVGAFPPDAPGRRIDAPQTGGALPRLVAALEASRSDRVLAIAPGVPTPEASALLALVAWPEADAVVPTTADGSPPAFGLYRRDAVLPAAREMLASQSGSPPASLAALLDAVETERVSPP